MKTFLWRIFPVALIAARGLLKSRQALAIPVEVAIYIALVVWTVHTFLCQVYLWLKNHDLLPDVSALTARWLPGGSARSDGICSFISPLSPVSGPEPGAGFFLGIFFMGRHRDMTGWAAPFPGVFGNISIFAIHILLKFS